MEYLWDNWRNNLHRILKTYFPGESGMNDLAGKLGTTRRTLRAWMLGYRNPNIENKMRLTGLLLVVDNYEHREAASPASVLIASALLHGEDMPE